MEGRLLYGPTPHSTPYFEQAKKLCGAQSFDTTSIGWLGHHLIFFLCSSKGGLLIDQVNICCTINVMGCTRLQCFATFRHEFSCQSVVTGGAGWLAYPSSPWYHGTAFIVNMVPWYTVHSQHVIMVRHGRYTYHSPPTHSSHNCQERWFSGQLYRQLYHQLYRHTNSTDGTLCADISALLEICEVHVV